MGDLARVKNCLSVCLSVHFCRRHLSSYEDTILIRDPMRIAKWVGLSSREVTLCYQVTLSLLPIRSPSANPESSIGSKIDVFFSCVGRFATNESYLIRIPT